LKETTISLKFQKKGKNIFEGVIVPLNITNVLSDSFQSAVLLDKKIDKFIEVIPVAQVKMKVDFPIKYGSDVFLECYNLFEFGKNLMINVEF
jgi:hypothetical protein